MSTVVSVGYEGRSIRDLLKTLREYKVTKLLDVRELPLSRRKGFSKKALSASLKRAGIEYVHIRAAGNPFRKEFSDIDKCLARYRLHLHECATILELVQKELGKTPTALLCVEACHKECHRSILIEALQNKIKSTKVVIAV